MPIFQNTIQTQSIRIACAIWNNFALLVQRNLAGAMGGHFNLSYKGSRQFPHACGTTLCLKSMIKWKHFGMLVQNKNILILFVKREHFSDLLLTSLELFSLIRRSWGGLQRSLHSYPVRALCFARAKIEYSLSPCKGQVLSQYSAHHYCFLRMETLIALILREITSLCSYRFATLVIV